MIDDYDPYYGQHPDDSHEAVYHRASTTRRIDASIYSEALQELRRRHQGEFDEIRLNKLIEAGVEINPSGPITTADEIFAFILSYYIDHGETPTLRVIERKMSNNTLSFEGVRTRVNKLIEAGKLYRNKPRGPVIINAMYLPTELEGDNG